MKSFFRLFNVIGFIEYLNSILFITLE